MEEQNKKERKSKKLKTSSGIVWEDVCRVSIKDHWGNAKLPITIDSD